MINREKNPRISTCGEFSPDTEISSPDKGLNENQHRFAIDALNELGSWILDLQDHLALTLLQFRTAEEYHACLQQSFLQVRNLGNVLEAASYFCRADVETWRSEMERVRVDLLFPELIGELIQEAADRQIALKLGMIEPVVVIGMSCLLSHLLSLLLQNTIMDAPGHSTVSLNLHRQDNLVRITFGVTAEDCPPEGSLQEGVCLDHIDTFSSQQNVAASLSQSLANEIVGLHGGSLKVDNSAYGGTSYSVRLPEATH